MALSFSVVFADSPPAPSTTDPLIGARASADKSSVTLGDLVTWSVQVQMPASTELTPPQFPSRLAGWEIVGPKPTKESKTDGNRVEKTFSMVLRADEIGDHTLPGVEIKYKSPGSGKLQKLESAQAKTSPVSVSVRSVLPPQDNNQPVMIRDIKPLAGAPREIPWYLLAPALALIALIAALILAKKRRRFHKATPPPKELLPHERAFQDLDQLQARKLTEKGLFREYFFELSEIFRRYLSERYRFSALDWTTEEISDHLPRVSEISPSHRQDLINILIRADRVKFAKAEISVQHSFEVFSEVARFIQRTKFVPEEEPVEVSSSALGP